MNSTEAAVVEDLQSLSYEEIAQKHGRSRGWVYSIAVKHNARKNEERIQMRRREKERVRREYLAELLNQVQKADVLDNLDLLPDECVQLHVTSFPYNVGKQYGNADLDRMAFKFYEGWCLQILSEMARTLKPGGVLALQVGKTRTDDGELYPIDCLLHDHITRMGLRFQNRVIWEIPHGLTPKQRLADRHEVVMIYTKGDVPGVFNPDPVRSPQNQPGKRAFKGENKGQLSGHPFGAHPSDVWRISNVGHNNPEKTGHPAQFPVELPLRLIQLYTLPDDLVCDVFMGSGTTAEAAIRTGRAFTGNDLFYEDIRAQRLADATMDDICSLPGVTPESVAVWQAEARRVEFPSRKLFDFDESSEVRA